MKLNINTLYAEFLTHFLSIIQKEEERNAATLGSGFLRVTILATAMVNIAADNSYIPLSAAMKAGLVTVKGNFIPPDHPLTISSGLSFDRQRTQGQLDLLQIDYQIWTETQQLVFVACYQEAMNRVLQAELFASADQFSGTLQETVTTLMKECGFTALAPIVTHLSFISGANTLTTEAINKLKQQRAAWYEQAQCTKELEIPEEILIRKEALQQEYTVSLVDRITLLDELLPTLTQEIKALNYQAQLARASKLIVLKIYSTILSMTLRDCWQVKTQWLQPGTQVQIGQQAITLPHSISKIIEIIVSALAQKDQADYYAALKSIQQIAVDYKNSWYTWGRNTFTPHFASPKAVSALIDEIIKINPEEHSSFVPPSLTQTSEQNTWGDYFSTGLSYLFFTEDTEEKAQDETPATRMTNRV